MRKKVIAGNWKMYKDFEETKTIINGLKETLGTYTTSTVVVCPPFTSLTLVSNMLKGTAIHLGAQNMYFETEGAFTGEVSGKMLKSVGCEYVILGHSERRQYFGETDEFINKKAKKALELELIPIVCVGETLDQREKGITKEIVTAQVRGVFKDITAEQVRKLIIAYEPVWAIGTGKTATPAQAQEVHLLIRTLIQEMFNKETAEALIIQYGGSVKPENAAELMKQPDIDGALVGGACLKADSFTAIVKAG